MKIVEKHSQANETAIITVVHYDCLKLYVDSMNTEFDRIQSHFDEIGLQKIHESTKYSAMLKVIIIILLEEKIMKKNYSLSFTFAVSCATETGRFKIYCKIRSAPRTGYKQRKPAIL